MSIKIYLAFLIDRLMTYIQEATADNREIIEVYGYHGTSMDAAIAIMESGFQLSNNNYDWLGEGVYFWQDAPIRAKQWAQSVYPEHPAVIESRICLGNCLDLLDVGWMPSIRALYNRLVDDYRASNLPLPTQRPDRSKAHRLDCALFDFAVKDINRSSGINIETIRSVFVEGENIYPNSAIYDLGHVQIAVRHTELIKESIIIRIDRI
jgi:hypothetical protein